VSSFPLEFSSSNTDTVYIPGLTPENSRLALLSEIGEARVCDRFLTVLG